MVAIWASETEPVEWSVVDEARAELVVAEGVRSAPPRWAIIDRATRVRRRRLVLLAAASVCLVSSALLGKALPGEAEPEPTDGVETGAPTGEVYIVQPGDDLWSVAARVAPSRDPRPIVDALRDANGGDASLDVGDRLVIADD